MSNTTPVRQQQCNMIKVSKNRLNHFLTSLAGSNARFYAFAGFMTLVFFTGGGSRDDIQSLIILRPLTILFGAYALTVMTRGQWEGRRFPLYFTLTLVVLMILQLIPLPPDIWTELPGRKIIADIATIAAIEQPWRPLSMSPSQTLNSLFSLATPIAAIMLYLNLDRFDRKRAISVIIILCSISAFLAIVQIVGPSRGPLYFYRITNFDIGVGLFANRNHQAVMLASAIAMLGWYAASVPGNVERAALKFYSSLATIFVFVPLIFLTGSRAGLILMIPALILALLFVFFGKHQQKRSSKKRSSKLTLTSLFANRQVVLLISVVIIVGIAVSSIMLSRSSAFDRLLGGNSLEGLRFQLLPTLFAMITEHMPFGSGFGSFEHVYRIYEPQELLNSSYLNEAHNDWLQFLIEGGAPAAFLAICAVLWFSRQSLLLLKCWKTANSTKYRSLVSAAVMLFLIASSIGDYPLRVPSIMAVFAVMACIFNDSIRSVQRDVIKQP